MLKWSSEADWDSASSKDGVVDEDVNYTDHNDSATVKRGYSISSPYLSGSLVSYWPMHDAGTGTVRDFAGSNNGNPQSVSAASAPLGTTSADCINSNGSYIPISNNYGTLFNGYNDFSVSFWHYSEQGINRAHYFSGTGSREFFIQTGEKQGNKQIHVRTNQNNDWFDPVVAPSFSSHVWYYIVATYNTSNGWKLYVDGSSVDSDPTTGGITSSSGNTNWGYGPGLSNYVDARLWDCRIYNKTLSSSEVQTLYDVVNTNGSLTTDWRSP